MRDRSATAQLLGMGTGSFPKLYSQGARHGANTEYRLVSYGGNQVLQLPGSAPIYFGQFVAVAPGERYVLSLDCRRRSPTGTLAIYLCEKTVQYSFRCLNRSIDVTSGQDAWHRVNLPIESGQVGGDTGGWIGSLLRRPVNLAFRAGPQDGVVEIDNVRLKDSKGRNLVSNGSFDGGNDCWFFTSDDHLAWHAQNLYIHLLVEHGWFGLSAFALFSCYALALSSKAALQGSRDACAVTCALVGFLALGVFDSLLDAPRIALLYYLLLGFAVFTPVSVVGRQSRAMLWPTS